MVLPCALLRGERSCTMKQHTCVRQFHNSKRRLGRDPFCWAEAVQGRPCCWEGWAEGPGHCCQGPEPDRTEEEGNATQRGDRESCPSCCEDLSSRETQSNPEPLKKLFAEGEGPSKRVWITGMAGFQEASLKCQLKGSVYKFSKTLKLGCL